MPCSCVCVRRGGKSIRGCHQVVLSTVLMETLAEEASSSKHKLLLKFDVFCRNEKKTLPQQNSSSSSTNRPPNRPDSM